MKTLPVFALLALSAAGWSQESNPAISAKMEEFIAKKEIAGAVTLVADADRTLYLGTTGQADVEENRPMDNDALFWIASMTKPITAAAVMMMQDEGLLSVDDPIAIYLPEFKDLKDADGNEVTVTIAQCLIHSSGLAEVSHEETAGKTTLAEIIPFVAAKPVQFTPGSKWAYCQSSINTAARIVEVVSGENFPDFLEKRLFAPLGMKDTTFYLTEEQLPRLASSYRRTSEGNLEKTAIGFLAGKSPTDRDRYPLANGGLFSTASDYAKFARMLLRGGELDGKRHLSESAVKQMTSVQSGDLTTGFTPGNGWGIGVCIVREPQGATATLSPGTFGHGGAYGTQAWIDPVKNRVHILLVQRANFPNADASEVRAAFHEAAAE